MKNSRKARPEILAKSEALAEVRRRTLAQHQEVPKILDGERMLKLRAILEKVVVADSLRDYAVRLVPASHPTAIESRAETVRQAVKWGASAALAEP